MRRILLLLAVFICFAAALCLPAPAPAESEEEQAEWTVLFYMCGSDLESKYGYATGNLKEIASCIYPRGDMKKLLDESGELDRLLSYPDPGKVNVLIETGGCREWHAEELGMEISSSALQRWRYECYTRDDVPDGFHLEETLPLRSMADPETLADFIRWGTEHYPAQKTALVLWDHGGGSKTGLFIDELFGQDIMSIKELGDALRAGGAQLEAILFDACMMANLETAFAVADSSKWMIASEEVVAGQGTAIRDWLQQLFIDPEFDGEWLGRWVCDMTQIKYANENDEQAQQLMTWSVIDLSMVPMLSRMFDMTMGLLGEIYVDYPQLMSLYTKYIVNTEHYGSSSDNMWDLAGIFYMPELALNMSVEVHRKLLNALKETVVYCLKGPGRSSARGLSFCYAVNFDKQELDTYAENCPWPHYLALLDAITPWTAPDWVYETAERLPEKAELPAYQVVAQKVMLEDGTPAVTFDQDCYLGASSVYYHVYRKDALTGDTVSLGTMPAFFDESVGENGAYRAVKPWMWPALEGQYIASYVIGRNNPDAKQYLGSIPLQIGTEKRFLRYGYFYEESRYVVYGIWDGYETNSGLFNRNVQSLSQLAGQEYRLLYPVYIGENETPDRFLTSEPQTLYRSMEIVEREVPPGTYYLQYVVNDMFMRPMTMAWIEMEWDGNELKLSDGLEWEGEEILTVSDSYWE